MKNHSSKPDSLDSVVLTYIIKDTIVNMPLKNKVQVALFKTPTFRVLGLWKIKKYVDIDLIDENR